MDKKIEEMIESFNSIYNSDSDISNNNTYTIKESLNILMSDNLLNESIMEQSSNKIHIENALKSIEQSLLKDNTFIWPYIDAPYFTPEESTMFRAYYMKQNKPQNNKPIDYKARELEERMRNTTDPDELAEIKARMDNSSSQGEFDSNFLESAHLYASTTKKDAKTWSSKVDDLMDRLRSTEDPEKIGAIKQELISLGWNPEVDFTVENRIRAKKRIESIYQERFKNILILDLTSLIESYSEDDVINESNKSNSIHPIHVILVKGNGPFSGAITKLTNSSFSHSAVCLDNDFDNLYSFNLDNKSNFTGGFSIENMGMYSKDGRLAVFTFFVSNDVYKSIKEKMEILKDGIKKTNYSIVNVLTLPFKNININFNSSMICSQFVDSIMKMCNMDITKINSSHVTPGDLYKSAAMAVKENSKIYKVFDGLVKDFNKNKVIRYINKMSNKPLVTKESSNIITDYLNPTLLEAKIPIEANKDGDILLRNNFVDFDSEYSASHKLLVQYEKSNNIEAMKYELARLYYMNYVLERKLYHNKLSRNREKNIKTRARVLNDFNKYLKYVLKKQPKFNFGEYYESSIFYPHTVQIKSSTMKAAKDIIKYIL